MVPTPGRVSYPAMTSSGRGSRSAARRKSRSVVPVHSESTLGGATPSTRSSRLTVRKSMLKRVRLVVFGTVECSCAAEKTSVPAGWGHHADVGLELERLLGLRLLAGLLLDLRGGLLAAGLVPLLVVVARGAVADRPVEVLRVEGHRVLRLDLVDRQPPVELLVRSREPGVAMRVELVGETRVQVLAVRHRPQPRHVEVCPGRIAAEFGQEPGDQLLRAAGDG